MATEIWDKFRNVEEAQASHNPTSGNFSAGAKAVISKASGGNAAGCQVIKLMLDVTQAPSSAATAEVYMEQSFDGGTTWTEPRFCGMSPIVATTAKKYHMGDVYDAGALSRLSWKPVGYQMTGTLYVQGVVAEAQ
jgi:hypothetical protein